MHKKLWCKSSCTGWLSIIHWRLSVERWSAILGHVWKESGWIAWLWCYATCSQFASIKLLLTNNIINCEFHDIYAANPWKQGDIIYILDGSNSTLHGLPQQCFVSIHHLAGHTDSHPNTSVDWSAESAKSGQHRSLMNQTVKLCEVCLQQHKNTAIQLIKWFLK